MMKSAFRFLSLLTIPLLLSFASSASAQAVKKGTLSGIAFTASATANSATVPLYTAPASGDGIAIITTVCGAVTSSNPGQRIVGSTLGELGVSGSSCQHFPNGLPLPANEVLSYANPFATDYSVTIAGVISKK